MSEDHLEAITFRGPMGVVHVDLCPEFKAGDPPPKGYSNWFAWAEVQEKAGLKQKLCGRCGRWMYPQELSGKEDVVPAQTRGGRKREFRSPVCLECAAKEAS